MKILDDWKVYGGVSDLKQRAEGIPVSQVIINSNYSDDHDDYDIALMKLSRPLTLSGEASQLAVPQGWAWLGLVFGEDRASLGMGKRQLGSPWSHPLGCTGLLPAGASRSAVATPLSPACPVVGNWPILPWRGPVSAHAAVGSAVQPALCCSLCPVWAVWQGGWQRPCLGGRRGEPFLHAPLLPSRGAGDYSGYFAPG